MRELIFKRQTICFFLLCILFIPISLTYGKNKPNFLIIISDDCTYNDLPLYGGKNAKTPHIDSLAKEGLVFNRAYLSEAMCQPCRSELYTGLYPNRNGCAWNHSRSKSDIQSMPHRLKPLGYRVGLAGKVHVKPQSVYPFEKVAGFDPNCVRAPTRPHDLNSLKSFISKEHEQPFCLVVALVEPHVPWVMGDASKYPPKKIHLPPNIADTKRTREDFSRYLAEITYMDSQVGEILKCLEEQNQSDNTLVLFSSEQGSQFPGCKWTNWDTGLHTALVARWPRRIRAGFRTNALVQYADILPTLIEAAGGKVKQKHFDGESFLEVLKNKRAEHRQYVYGVHNNVPEGPPYPIRSISDGRFRYIRNLTPNELYIEKHLMGKTRSKGPDLNNPYWGTWIAEAWNNPEIYKLVKRYMQRPKEELYSTTEDPYELKNLAGDPNYEAKLKVLSRELDRWLKSQDDPGIEQDTLKALEAARQGKHLFGNTNKK